MIESHRKRPSVTKSLLLSPEQLAHIEASGEKFSSYVRGLIQADMEPPVARQEWVEELAELACLIRATRDENEKRKRGRRGDATLRKLADLVRRLS